MALEIGKTYYIKNVATGKYLNVYGNDTVANERNVNVYTKEDVLAQKWIVRLAGNGAQVHTAINEAFALNIYTVNNNCSMYKVADNSLADSVVDFLTVDASQNLYRIQMMAHSLYLTVNTSTDNAYFGTDNESFYALWQLEEVDTSSDSEVVSSATVENINQNDFGNQEHNTFCYATCILAILRRYKGTSFTMDRLIDEGIVRGSDGYVNYSSTPYYSITDYLDINNDYSDICNEIEAGRPVIIYGQSSTSGHFVVADSFTSRTANGIIVMDPWTGTHVKLTESTLNSYTDYRKYTNK